MNKPRRAISRADILPTEQYAAIRKQRRTEMVALKQQRRVEVGPVATFYFENYDTMLQQIQEMLYIEKGGEAQIEDELTAYNPLVPQGSELICTLMFEIEDPVRRERVLRTLSYIERATFIQVGDQRIMAAPEPGEDRTREDGKTSSVHFLHFPFTPALISAFRDPAQKVMLGFDHENYAHMAQLSPQNRAALAGDFAA